MVWEIRRRFTLSFLSLTLRTHHLNSTCFQHTPCPLLVNPITVSDLRLLGTQTLIIRNPLRCYGFPIFFSSFISSVEKNPNFHTVETDDDTNDNGEDDDNDDGEDKDHLGGELGFKVQGMLDILQAPGAQAKSKLEQCGVTPSTELVVEVLSRVRNSWEAAFTFFLWAGNQPGYAHSLREYHSMISILGKMRKFDTAWALIDEMRGGKTSPSLVTPQTLLIMIRRYCAVHDVGKAVSTFYAHKRFKFCMGMEEFQSLLSALCRYKNVKDAEQLMFCNKNDFPFNTKSFNIILNGWCNIIGDPREARRIWEEMKERRIAHDVISYASIISCYSKTGNLYAVLKLFDQMKVLDVVPDRKVYNAVIHALAKGRLVKEARNLMKAMEDKGIVPNIVTYNSLIRPLSWDHRLDEVREVFSEMLERGLSPTVRTYHSLFRTLKTEEGVFALLEKMNQMGCKPGHDTYVMLIRKFCRWRQLDNVINLWSEMGKNGLDPDRSSYVAIIHGLFFNGRCEEAYRYYKEMKEKQLVPEPQTDEMLQAWVSGKQATEQEMINSKEDQVTSSQRPRNKRFDRERDFHRHPETRRVVRERGFSFWES